MDDEIDALAAGVGRVLVLHGLTCTTAESCTGGLVAAAITSVAGSSGWFERGFITYSDAAKMDLLDVPAETLARHGAVSEATARAMAEGALARAGAQISVSITGIAGPGGGTPVKPVGMVCLAWGRTGRATCAETRNFTGDRHAVRRASVLAALRGLIELSG